MYPDLVRYLNCLLLAFDDNLFHGCWLVLELNRIDRRVTFADELLDLDIIEVAVPFVILVR